MQPVTFQTFEQQYVLNQQDQNVIRYVGRLIGRTIATITAAFLMRILRTRHDNQTIQQEQQQEHQAHQAHQAQNPAMHLWEQVQDEAAVAATTVFTWNAQLGGETGANVSEYIVDRINNFASQNFNYTGMMPRSAVTVADRVADNMIWRLAKYATGQTGPEPTMAHVPCAHMHHEAPRMPF